MNTKNFKIDNLQYCNWSKEIFEINNEAKLDAIHVTIAYHEDFSEVEKNISVWNNHFKNFKDLIFHGKTFKDIEKANKEKKTAVFFGFQNCSPIGDNIGLVEEIYKLGIIFMQLTYNNQSLLATGCYEKEDTGITRMGRQVIKEMNRVGLVVDMSHSADRSTIEAAAISERPIAITHANPHAWHPALRNKRHEVLKAVTDAGGMLGFSLYPHHIKNKSDCTLQSFCEMIARAADSYGVHSLGIGSDLCQDQPDSVVEWMRVGRWSKEIDYGESKDKNIKWPKQPHWYQKPSDITNLFEAMCKNGFKEQKKNCTRFNWYFPNSK